MICIDWFSNIKLTFHSNPTWSWFAMFYIYCWVCFAKFMRESGLFSCIVCFYYQSNAGLMGFPRRCSVKEPACQCRGHKRCGFDPWVGKMPWRRRWQPTAESLPSKSHGQRNLVGYSPWDYKHQTWLNNWAPAHTELWKSKCGKSFVLLSLNFFFVTHPVLNHQEQNLQVERQEFLYLL